MKRNPVPIIFFLVSLILPQSVLSQVKIIGYLPVNRAKKADRIRIHYDKITHLNLAFINPDTAGNFAFAPVLDTIVQEAHLHNVKVLASIGGGNSPGHFKNLLKEENRSKLVAGIILLARRHQLDGIDVDLEGDAIDDHYEGFLLDLRNGVKHKKLLLTAAVSTGYGPRITDRALSCLDLVNIMSYDKTGPWKPDLPGPHAPFSMAENDLVYWNKTRQISRRKLILGVPFYGYLFGKPVTALAYSEIVQKFQGAEKADSISLEKRTPLFYNGLETIKKKTKLAMDKAGGIMIWQLLQDSEGETSLLGAIDAVVGNKRQR